MKGLSSCITIETLSNSGNSMLRNLLAILADGDFHSGEELGAQLGVTRAAVWKQLKKLESLNIPLSSVKGKGYRLSDAIELLDQPIILSKIEGRLDCLEVLLNTESTNSYLLDKASDHMGKRYAVLAEKQESGRGRRGRIWVSPFGKNIYLSMLWSFSGGIGSLEGLSLVIAIAVERALAELGVSDAKLKWPNDVYLNNKKLAGILLEVSGEYSGHCQVVIGIGLNIKLSAYDAESIDQPWAQLSEHLGDVDRNTIAATMINNLIKAIEQFDKQGFESFKGYWTERDAFLNKEVDLILPRDTRSGIAKGVNSKGELLLLTDKGLESINAGELSLRLKNAPTY
jgi:BirA family biotin operon repressor/biotin-[acetyl-CoA-carboxylase] ligase